MKISNVSLPRWGILTLLLAVLAPFALVPSAVSANGPETDRVPYHLTPAQLNQSLEIRPDTARPDDYVRVLYFHRVPGCPTCQLMSKYVYETIKTRFSKEVQNREVIISFHNFEDSRNAKLVKTFNIGSPSLVLIQGRDGKDVKAKTAGKIWPLAGDREKFFDYVEGEIDAYLQELHGGSK